MRARAGKERYGVRVKTDSETGERHTPHGACGASFLRPVWSSRASRENIHQASASHLAKPILRKVRLFCSLRGLLTKYSDLYEIQSQTRFIGMEQWNAEWFKNRTVHSRLFTETSLGISIKYT